MQRAASTASALFSEAAPYNKVWGVGKVVDDPRFSNPAKWQGENLFLRELEIQRTPGRL